MAAWLVLAVAARSFGPAPPPTSCGSALRTRSPVHVNVSALPSCSAGAALGTLCRATVPELHPTQAPLGMLLAGCKTAKLNGKSASKMAKYLQSHPVPAVIGPGNELYITDHHHLTYGLVNSKWAALEVYVCPQKDLSSYSTPTQFWAAMARDKDVYLSDNQGNPIPASEIPSRIGDMHLDDPYRSLSEWVRDDYGYIKCTDDTASFPQCGGSDANPPFLEFIWGDAVRSALPVSGIYGLKPSKQVAPLLKIYQDALKAVKEPKYSALPHYNSATAQPTPPVSVDPSTGCEN